MTKKENLILKRIYHELEMAGDGFNKPEEDYERVLTIVQTLVDTLLVMQEFEADMVETKVMKKTTQRSPEWRGKANC